MKKYWCIGILLSLLFIVSGRMFADYIKKTAESKVVWGMVCDYTYFDRKLTKEDFFQFDHSTTYEEMIECIGKENGRYGSGGASPYYELDDGTYAICSCLSGDMMRGIFVVDKRKKLYTLLEGDWQ